jgi:hypothetical protein
MARIRSDQFLIRAIREIRGFPSCFLRSQDGKSSAPRGHSRQQVNRFGGKPADFQNLGFSED